MQISSIRVAILASSLALGLAACGSSVDSNTGGTGTTSSASGGGGSSAGATLESYCEGRIARQKKCDPANASTLEECLANADAQCIFTGFRPDVREALVTCLNDRECNTGDDPCYYESGLANPAAGQNEFIADCQAKLTSCGASGFSDDYCYGTLMKAETYTALSACLEGACDTINDCFAGVIEAVCPGM